LLTGAEVAVTDLAGEVEDTLLSVVVVTDSGVVTHLADSPAVALVRDSAGRGDFLLVDFLVAEITAALVTVVSVTIVSFFNSLPRLFIGIPTILMITPIWITDRITTINMGTIQPRLCNRNPPDPPSTMARLSSPSTQATPGPWIQGPILGTSIAATVRPTQQGNKE
jgi:hypothetical protein